MATGRRVILMGLRASGKSTIGPLLAARLGVGFIDLDDRTAALAQRTLGVASCAELLRSRGEAEFRRVEHEALAEVLGEVPGEARARGGGWGVLALGGGTATHEPSCGLIERARGAGAEVVYLHASPSELARRLRATDVSSRPGLMSNDPVGEVAAVYAWRDGLYRSLATRVIEVEGREPGSLVEQLCAASGQI
jgi:shikimate kinase